MKKRLKQAQDEDDVSDEELQKQLDEFNFYKSKRELEKIGEDNLF